MPISLTRNLFFIASIVAIFIWYVLPTVETIRSNQDQSAVFRREAAFVSDVNAALSQKVSSMNQLPLTQRRALDVYIPTELEADKIMSDIEAILMFSNIQPTSIVYAEVGEVGEGGVFSDLMLENAQYDVVFSSSYESALTMFDALARNNYPIIPTKVDFAQTEDGQLSVNVTLAVFYLNYTSARQEVSSENMVF